MTNQAILGRIEGNLDEKDWIIIQLVQSDARISFAEIGRRAGLSPPAAAERLRRLEDAGVIRGYHAKINPDRLGLGMLAITLRCVLTELNISGFRKQFRKLHGF